MVVEGVLGAIPSNADDINEIINYLRAIGIIFLVYFALMIFKTITTFKTNKILKGMKEDLQKIKKKLRIK